MNLELVNEVRLHVLRATMESAAVPSATEAAAALGISEDTARAAYRQLAEAHVYVLEPQDPSRLRMANPFSAVPTPFRVEAAGMQYYGNCVWDGLGVVSLMGGTGTLRTSCPDCNEGLMLTVSGHELTGAQGVVHFSVPARQWWDDIIHT